MQYIDGAGREGASLVVGGRHPSKPRLAQGCFIGPTIFVNVRPTMTIVREEVFGPVLSVLKWRGEDDLFDDVNRVEFGLTASVWTRYLATERRAAARLEVDCVWVNDCSVHILGAPFGGYKQLGPGREESKEQLLELTTKNTTADSILQKIERLAKRISATGH